VTVRSFLSSSALAGALLLAACDKPAPSYEAQDRAYENSQRQENAAEAARADKLEDMERNHLQEMDGEDRDRLKR
jgi:hypothetical protein